MVNIPPIKIVIWGIVFLIGLPTLHHLQTRESCCHYGDEGLTIATEGRFEVFHDQK